MSQNLVRFAAEHNARQASTPMRRHDDQIALLLLGSLHDALPRMIVALAHKFDWHACCLTEADETLFLIE